MKDKQRDRFDQLIQKRLPETISAKSTEISDELRIDFSLIKINVDDKIRDSKGTVYVPVCAKCKLWNTSTMESVSFNVELLKLPVYQELGFMINNNYMQMLDSYDKTAGLHTSSKETQSEDSDKSIIQSADNFKSIGFVRNKDKMFMELKLKSGVKDAIPVPPATFLRAISGMSNEELIAKFGYENSFLISIFDNDENKNASRGDCIQKVFCAMFGEKAAASPDSGTISTKLAEINRWLFNSRFFKKDRYSMQRIQYLQSFSYRAEGCVLTKDVEANGVSASAGVVLSPQLLRELDATGIKEITVSFNDRNFNLHKYAPYWFGAYNCTLASPVEQLGMETGRKLSLDDIDALNASQLDEILTKDSAGRPYKVMRSSNSDVLTMSDIFAMFDIWVNNLNGFGVYDDEFDLTNRMLVPFDQRVVEIVSRHVDTIIRSIANKFAVKGTTTGLDDYVQAFDKDIKVDAFIDQIRSNELNLGQLSEMCNAMSFLSKDYKSTIANLKNIDDKLVNIQNHQYGRTDPFDVPESKKLASVQYRTVTSGLNEAGYITTPYIRVHAGEVVSDEPVYLTAIDETNRYIAEWNETFKDENGNKKAYVVARYNGNVVTTDVDNVSYKDYSPYSGMSVAHACAVFPGHSDGKRITMQCNQIYQATPMVHSSRPFVNGGGESMVDFGFYEASVVLNGFYNNEITQRPYLKDYKDKILNSDIKLLTKHTEHGTLTLTFMILAMADVAHGTNNLPALLGDAGSILSATESNTYELSVPYAMQTTDNTLMSFKINPKEGNIYHCDDVICYSNSCSLKNLEHQDFMDTGAQKLSDRSMSRGLALVSNLRVGYKTWEGSTIDDAITISDECVYDDILTSIFTTRITLSAKSYSDTEYERFGLLNHQYGYFEENGLPKVGTYLDAGDPVIAKIVHTNDSEKAKYKYLRMNQSGQVIHADFTMKNNEEVAEVVLANRNVVEVGDKFAGRCGNKGVVAKIVPAEQMPFDPETGFRLQVLLNPLGVPSRQNISQFLDVDLSECMRQDNKMSYVSPYNDNDLDIVMDAKEKHGVKPKIFIDGRTGKPFERPIHWGTMSMYKLHHMIKKKYHAIGMSAPVDPVYMQPRQSSKLDGGQSFGEMEAWCLMSVGANNIMQELFSYMSTDITTRSNIRSELESGLAPHYYVDGNNSNYATMLVCFRSLGVDFKTNYDEKCFEFHPLTDSQIRSFSPNPVDSVLNLHNSMIFGGASGELHTKDKSRDSWGWIDLKVELIHPNFIQNSRIISLLSVDCLEVFTKEDADLLMRGYTAVGTVNSKVGCFELYKTSLFPAGIKDSKYANVPDVTEDIEVTTGIDAIVMMFRYTDTETLERNLRDAAQAWKTKNHVISDDDPILAESTTYSSIISRLHFVSEFNKCDSLENYIIASFPVMPQIYRPTFSGARQTEHADFDWHYGRILSAVEAMEHNDTVETRYKIYENIKSFCGLSKNQTKEEKKYKNIKTYFSGSNNGDHGKLRTNVQSKKVMCSGRSTIIPAGDTSMKPTEIGVPMIMAIKMYESQLIGEIRQWENNDSEPLQRANVARALLLCAKRNHVRFIKFWDAKFDNTNISGISAYNRMTKLIYDFVEGRGDYDAQVVMSGRQPSLHKFAIRCYRPKIVLDNTIHVHTLVCHGYNADFDGDQVWVQALLADASKQEGMSMLSPENDCINPKDSSLVLKHTQDVVLGLYCMSMLKNNRVHADISASDIQCYQSLYQIETDLELGMLHTYDFVCIKYDNRTYISTAGRICLNYLLNGFTNEVFTNPCGISGIDCSRYYELKYDGILCAGSLVSSGCPRYYKIADACMDIYNNDNRFMDVMQKLTEFGFYYADKFGISLSLEDLMLHPVDECIVDEQCPEAIASADIETLCSDKLDQANRVKAEIERDYYNGLVSESDKDAAIMTLYYKDTNSGGDTPTNIYSSIRSELVEKLSKTQRNNNIFIMIDSGARGSVDQLMRMCCFLPQLQKDKQSSLKTPVTNNFVHGLSSMDVHMTSFGIKQGLASTQNETPQAGYATHKSVYMASGVKVVESDCGKTDWWYDVRYDDMDNDRTVFLPTKTWFVENLVDRKVALDSDESLRVLGLSKDNNVISEKSYGALIVNCGFHTIQFDDGTFIGVPPVIGTILHSSDKLGYMKLKNTLNERAVTAKTLTLIEQLKIESIITNIGTYSFKYKMSECSRSLLLHRQCRDLPFAETKVDVETGKELLVTTKQTISYIEKMNLRRVPVRILLDCKSKNGVCSHCYGLKFSSLHFPHVGEFVGTESAQAMGEPSAQLTISLINKGGKAGEAIDDGVKKFSSMLDGTVKNPAQVSPRSGYVQIESFGEKSAVSVRPVNKNCELCKNCHFGGECPTNKPETPKCFLKDTVETSLLICRDGDWVEASQPLTLSAVSPDSISVVTECVNENPVDTTDFKYVFRRKQIVWLESYFYTFFDKSIDINARHFELFTRIQNLYGFVYASTNPDFKIGEIYEIPKLINAKGVSFKPQLSSRSDVILRTSGAMAALSFERIQKVAASLCVNEYHSSYDNNNSPLGSIAVGTDLVTGVPKKLGSPVVSVRTRTKPEPQPEDHIFYKDIEVKKIDDSNDDVFGDLNFEELFGSTTDIPTEITIPEEHVPEADVAKSNLDGPRRISFDDFADNDGFNDFDDLDSESDDISNLDDFDSLGESETEPKTESKAEQKTADLQGSNNETPSMISI